MADEVNDQREFSGMSMVSLDEMEELAQSQSQDAEPATEQKPAGPDMGELMQKINALENALKLSENARLQAQQNAFQQQPQQQVEDDDKPLTDDELAQLMQQDPVAAVRYMQERSLKEAEKHLERRLAGLSTGGFFVAQQNAKQKYATEFELFEKEINQAIQQLGPQGREALSNPENWDQLIGYIRGQPGNFERYFEHRQRAIQQEAATVARQAAERSGGYSVTSRQTAQPSSDDAGLDPIQRQIAEELGISPKDYKAWAKI